MDCAGYWPQTSDPLVVEGFRRRFPTLTDVADKDRLLEDRTIALVVTAAIPRERAALAIAAMEHGKDVLSDKPGIINGDDLAAVQRCVEATGRIFHVCFSERLLTPVTTEAIRLVRAGAIGRVVHTAGFGPHRLNRALRPAWFWETATYGGILADIASHQIDQFLVFAGVADAEIAMASVGERGTAPGFQDFGEVALRAPGVTGFIRVDWFTPDGLQNWGDGRLFIVGTEGTIELRKYLDIEGRPGTDHLFLSDHHATRHVSCAGRPIGYFRALAADIAARTETAMAQAHVFTVCRLAIEAQARATRLS